MQYLNTNNNYNNEDKDLIANENQKILYNRNDNFNNLNLNHNHLDLEMKLIKSGKDTNIEKIENNFHSKNNSASAANFSCINPNESADKALFGHFELRKNMQNIIFNPFIPANNTDKPFKNKNEENQLCLVEAFTNPVFKIFEKNSNKNFKDYFDVYYADKNALYRNRPLITTKRFRHPRINLNRTFLKKYDYAEAEISIILIYLYSKKYFKENYRNILYAKEFFILNNNSFEIYSNIIITRQKILVFCEAKYQLFEVNLAELENVEIYCYRNLKDLLYSANENLLIGNSQVEKYLLYFRETHNRNNNAAEELIDPIKNKNYQLKKFILTKNYDVIYDVKVKLYQIVEELFKKKKLNPPNHEAKFLDGIFTEK